MNRKASTHWFIKITEVTKVSRQVPLRSILIAPFVLQLFAAVGLVGYLSFRNGQKAVNDLASQLRSEISQRIQENVHTYQKSAIFCEV